MLRNRLSYLVILLAVLLFFICFNGYLSLYVLLVTLAIPLLSLLLSLPSVFCVNLSLTPKRLFTGKGQELPLSLKVKSRLPLASGRIRVTLTVRNTLTGEARKERLAFTAGRTGLTVTYQLSSASCGQVLCRLSKGRIYDYMGLFLLPLRLTKAARCEVLFYPAVYRTDLTVVQIPVPDGDGDAYSQKKPGNDPSEIFAFREYREGDKLSRIHWKLSQKAGTPLVKELGLPIADHIFFLLDLNGTGMEADALLDAFATLSAFLSESEIAYRVGFWSGNAPEFTVLEAANQEDAVKVLSALLLSRPRAAHGQLRGEDLPTGVSHALYLCSRPDSGTIDLLRLQMPSARLSILPVGEEAASIPDGAELTRLHQDHIAEDLAGFCL